MFKWKAKLLLQNHRKTLDARIFWIIKVHVHSNKNKWKCGHIKIFRLPEWSWLPASNSWFSTATTIESGKTIRPRIQQTGANLSKISWQLISETAAFKLWIGSCLLNSGPDRFAAFNCCCSVGSVTKVTPDLTKGKACFLPLALRFCSLLFFAFIRVLLIFLVLFSVLLQWLQNYGYNEYYY